MTIHNTTLQNDERSSRIREVPLDEQDERPIEVEAETIETRPVTPSERKYEAQPVDSETPYLSNQSSAQANDRWKRVQADFVDDPRKSVSEAHELVSEMVQHIVDSFSHERDNLENTWSKGESVSTEDLRVCLQRYRAFFSRLLPSANGLDTH
jgi:molecular chaperone GrpE (heat shock protein)